MCPLLYKKIVLIAFLFALLHVACNNHKPVKTYSPQDQAELCVLPISGESTGNYAAYLAKEEVFIDGEGKEESWSRAAWRDISYRWYGKEYSQQDFQGRYKMLWNKTTLFFLIEIVDNVLYNPHNTDNEAGDGLVLFINKSGRGEHEKYYIFPERTDNHPIKMKRTYKGNLHTWEMALMMPVASGLIEDGLYTGRKLNFALAYHDNDGKGKENSIGSIDLQKQNETNIWGDLELID